MTEEIKTRQTAEQPSAVESGQRADTGSARYGAERKPMVSWAARLEEGPHRERRSGGGGVGDRCWTRPQVEAAYDSRLN